MDINRINDIVRLLARSFGLIAFDTNGQCRIELRKLARDILFRRRDSGRVTDDSPHVVERGLPVLTKRDDIDKCPVNRTADVILTDRRLQIAAPCPCPCFETPVDHLHCQQINQYLLIIDDRIRDLLPGPCDDHGNESGQGRFYQNLADFGQVLRLTKIGNHACLPVSLPLGKMFVQQFDKQSGILVAGDNDNRVLGPVPTLMKLFEHFWCCSTQGLRRPNRRAIGQTLPGKEQFPGRILDLGLWSGALSQLGQDNRTFRVNRLCAQTGRTDHTRQYFEAFIEACSVSVRQIEFVNGLRRCRFSVAVAPERCAKPLPNTLGLAVRNMR